MGSIEANKQVITRVEIANVGTHTRLLEEPVDLALTDPVVLIAVEQP